MSALSDLREKLEAIEVVSKVGTPGQAADARVAFTLALLNNGAALIDVAEAAQEVWEEDSADGAFVGMNLRKLGNALARVGSAGPHPKPGQA